jgi:hypothetical protein
MSLLKCVVCLGTLAIGIASAASAYQVTFVERTSIAGRELKPGDYKVEVAGDKATIKAGKNTVEAAVKTVTGDELYHQTAVRYTNGDGKYHLSEIRLGGTKTKLVFDN